MSLDPTLYILSNRRTEYSPLIPYINLDDTLKKPEVKYGFNKFNKVVSSAITANPLIQIGVDLDVAILANIDAIVGILNNTITFPSNNTQTQKPVTIRDFDNNNETPLKKYLDMRNMKYLVVHDENKATDLTYTNKYYLPSLWSFIQSLNPTEDGIFIFPIFNPQDRESLDLIYTISHITKQLYAFKPVVIDYTKDVVWFVAKGFNLKNIKIIKGILQPEMYFQFDDYPSDLIDYIFVDNKDFKHIDIRDTAWMIWSLFRIPPPKPLFTYIMKKHCVPRSSTIKLYKESRKSPVVDVSPIPIDETDTISTEYYGDYLVNFGDNIIYTPFTLKDTLLNNIIRRYIIMTNISNILPDITIRSKLLLSERFKDINPIDDIIPSHIRDNREFKNLLERTEELNYEEQLYNINKAISEFNNNIANESSLFSEADNGNIKLILTGRNEYIISKSQYNKLKNIYIGETSLFDMNLYNLIDRYSILSSCIVVLPENFILGLQMLSEIPINVIEVMSSPIDTVSSNYYSAFEVSDSLFGSKGHPLSTSNRKNIFATGGIYFVSVPRSDYYAAALDSLIMTSVKTDTEPLLIVVATYGDIGYDKYIKYAPEKTITRTAGEFILRDGSSATYGMTLRFYVNELGASAFNLSYDNISKLMSTLTIKTVDSQMEELIDDTIKSLQLDLLQGHVLFTMISQVNDRERKLNILEDITTYGEELLKDLVENELYLLDIQVNYDLLTKNNITTPEILTLFKRFYEMMFTISKDVIYYWSKLIGYTVETTEYEDMLKLYTAFVSYINKSSDEDFQSLINFIR